MSTLLYELCAKICATAPKDHDIHKLFWNICLLDPEQHPGVSGLSQAQRSIFEDARTTVAKLLRTSLHHPLSRLLAPQMDLLLFEHREEFVCESCTIASFCKSCTVCRPSEFAAPCAIRPNELYTHRLLHPEDTHAAGPLAKIEVLYNQLYNGLHALEKPVGAIAWDEFDESIFDVGPKFAMQCLCIIFDGRRLRHASNGTVAINEGNTTYDLFRIASFALVLLRGLRADVSASVQALRRAACLAQPENMTPTSKSTRCIFECVAALSPAQAHRALLSRQYVHRDGQESVSLFEAAKSLLPAFRPLQAVARVCAEAFTSLMLPRKGEWAFVDAHALYPPPPVQLTYLKIKKGKRGASIDRVAAGFFRPEPVFDADSFQYALTLASVCEQVGQMTRGNAVLEQMNLNAIEPSLKWADIVNALHTSGPLRYFTLQAAKEVATGMPKTTEWYPALAETAIQMTAHTALVKTVDHLDNINLSRGAESSLYVTRVLNAWAMMGRFVYQGSAPSWGVLVEATVLRKRGGE